jgi:hypothetical protein
VTGHTRHARGLPEDVILSQILRYIMSFTILQLKGYLIKSFFLSIIYIFFMPLLNVITDFKSVSLSAFTRTVVFVSLSVPQHRATHVRISSNLGRSA